jgi:predicted DNA-binding protein
MMPESEAKTRWMRENSTNLTIKFMHKSDADILAFLEGKTKATIIKEAIREYMENHKGET